MERSQIRGEEKAFEGKEAERTGREAKTREVKRGKDGGIWVGEEDGGYDGDSRVV